MAKYNHNINGNIVPFTAEEEVARDAEIQAWNDGKLDRRLGEIREFINKHLLRDRLNVFPIYNANIVISP